MVNNEIIAYIRALEYVIEAMLLAIHGSMRKDRVHRWVYYTLSLTLLMVSIGSTLRTGGLSLADVVLDFGVTPVLFLSIVFTAWNIWRVRKTM